MVGPAMLGTCPRLFLIFALAAPGLATAQPGQQADPRPTPAPVGPPQTNLPPYGVPQNVQPAPPSPWPNDGEHRSGLVLGAALGLGDLALGQFHAGIMMTPHLELFASAGFAVPRGGDSAARLLMGGIRGWFDRVYADVRFGQAHSSYSCDFDDCGTITTDKFVTQLGAGFELVHTNVVGFGPRVDMLIVDGDTAVSAGLALDFYLH